MTGAFRLRPNLAILGAGALLLMFSALAADDMARWGCTRDERSHIPAGYAYLTTGDFRLNMEHPPLAKELSALGLLSVKPDLPVDGPAWRLNDQWAFADAFFLGNRAPVRTLLFRARLPRLLLVLLLGALVFFWARALYGDVGGAAALLALAACPTLLAHAVPVAMDFPLALFFFGCFYGLWRYSKTPSRAALYGAAISAALAACAKFPGLMVYPPAAILLFILLRREASGPGPWRIGGFWARYAFSLGLFAAAGLTATVAVYGSVSGPLTYLQGLKTLGFNHSQLQLSYCLGTLYHGSRWYYFPIALALKTPLPLLAFSLAGLLGLLLNRSRRPDAAFLLLPPAFLAAVTIATVPDNIGIRYLLPLYPFMAVWSAAMGRLRNPALRVLWGIGLVWMVVGAVRAHPDEMAYFNETVPANRGYRFLAASDVDWGQALPLAGRAAVPDRTAYAWLFGPKARYADLPFRSISGPDLAHPGEGRYFVSAHWLAVGSGVRWLWRVPPAAVPGRAVFAFDLGPHSSDTARAAYRAGLERAPLDAALWADYGAFCAEAGDAGEADRAFREALRLDEDHPYARASLARLWLKRGDAGRGLAWVEETLARTPGDVRLIYAAADACLASDDDQRAARLLARLCALPPRHLDIVSVQQMAHIKLGILRQRQGHGRLALLHFDQALDTSDLFGGNRASALSASAALLIRMDRPSEARGRLEEALTLTPEDGLAHMLLGRLLIADPREQAAAAVHLRSATNLLRDPELRESALTLLQSLEGAR